MAAQAFHSDGVADVEAEEEPVRVGLGEGAVIAVHGQRITRVDPCDAGADHDPGRRTEQPAGEHERFPPGHLREQDRAVPQRVELRGEVARRLDGLQVECVGPDTDGSEHEGHD